IVEDQNAGTRRLELPHDRPDGGDVLAVAVEPKKGGGSRPPSTALHRPQVPPHQLRPVARDQLDSLPVLDAHALGIGQARPRRRKGEPLLEQPGEQEEPEIREPEAHEDSKRQHARKYVGARHATQSRALPAGPQSRILRAVTTQLTCPSCRAEIPRGAAFCPACGSASPTVITDERATAAPAASAALAAPTSERLARALGPKYE